MDDREDDDYFGPVESEDVEASDASTGSTRPKVVGARGSSVQARDEMADRSRVPNPHTAKREEERKGEEDKKKSRQKMTKKHDKTRSKKSRHTREEERDSAAVHEDHQHRHHTSPSSLRSTPIHPTALSLSASPSVLADSPHPPTHIVQPAQRKSTSHRNYASSRAHRRRSSPHHPTRHTDDADDDEDDDVDMMAHANDRAVAAEDYDDDFDEVVDEVEEPTRRPPYHTHSLSPTYDDDFEEPQESDAGGRQGATHDRKSLGAPSPLSPDMLEAAARPTSSHRTSVTPSPPAPLTGTDTNTHVATTLSRVLAAVEALRRDGARQAEVWQRRHETLEHAIHRAASTHVPACATEHMRHAHGPSDIPAHVPHGGPSLTAHAQTNHTAAAAAHRPQEAAHVHPRRRSVIPFSSSSSPPTTAMHTVFAQLARDVREVLHGLHSAVVCAERERVRRDERQRRAVADAWQRTMQEELRQCRAAVESIQTSNVTDNALHVSADTTNSPAHRETHHSPVRTRNSPSEAEKEEEHTPEWATQLMQRCELLAQTQTQTALTLLAPRIAELVGAAMTEEWAALRRTLAESAASAQRDRLADVTALRQWHDRSDADRAAAATALAGELSGRVERVAAVCAETAARVEAQMARFLAASRRGSGANSTTDNVDTKESHAYVHEGGAKEVGTEWQGSRADDASRLDAACVQLMTRLQHTLERAQTTYMNSISGDSAAVWTAMLERLERCSAQVEAASRQPCATCASHLTLLRACTTAQASPALCAVPLTRHDSSAPVAMGFVPSFPMAEAHAHAGYVQHMRGAEEAEENRGIHNVYEAAARVSAEWCAREWRRVNHVKQRARLAEAARRMKRAQAALSQRARRLCRRERVVHAASRALRERAHAVHVASRALRRARAAVVQRCVAVQRRVRAAMRQMRGYAERGLRRRVGAMRRVAEAAMTQAQTQTQTTKARVGGQHAESEEEANKTNVEGEVWREGGRAKGKSLQRTGVVGRGGEGESEEGGWTLLTRMHVDLANQRDVLAKIASMEMDCMED